MTNPKRTELNIFVLIIKIKTIFMSGATNPENREVKRNFF